MGIRNQKENYKPTHQETLFTQLQETKPPALTMKDYEIAAQKISFGDNQASNKTHYKMVKNTSSSSIASLDQEITDNYAKAGYGSSYSGNCNYGGYGSSGCSSPSS